MITTLSIQDICEHFIGSELTGEEFLSEAYHYKITFYSNNYETPDFFIGKTALIRTHAHKVFHGQIEACTITDDDRPIRKICITLAPSIYLLHHHQTYNIYLQQNVPEIVVALLKEFKIYNYDLSKLRKKYPKKDYCSCFNESTFDFIKRILAEENIHFYFRHAEDKHTIVFDDSLKNTNPLIKPTNTPGPVLARITSFNTVNKKNAVPIHFHHEYFKRNTEIPGPWAPITQHWGGNNHNYFFVPDDTQEVLINFINDDPNQPVIIGSLRNDQHKPPFEGELASGIKLSHNLHEKNNYFHFNDEPAAQTITMHSHTHLQQTIKGNQYKYIRGTSHTQLKKGNTSKNIAKSYVINSAKELHIQCGTSSIKIEQNSIRFEAEAISWK